MWQDVVDLNAFYTSPPGQVAARMIRNRLRAIWPDSRGQSVLGLGYATPFLLPYRNEAKRVIAMMPASQGVMPWPREEARLVALTDEADLPLGEGTVDRVLLIHAVECSEQLRLMLGEVWRVLAANGRLLVVAPNRRGIWARLERTPFGHGQPFSRPQLSRLLRENQFSPLQSTSALFVPPGSSRFMMRFAGAWENMGHKLALPFAGVILIEASKQVYAVRPQRAGVKRGRPTYGGLVARPLASPVASPVTPPVTLLGEG